MGLRADTGDHLHCQGREKIFFRAGGHVDQAMRFGQCRGDFCDRPGWSTIRRRRAAPDSFSMRRMIASAVLSGGPNSLSVPVRSTSPSSMDRRVHFGGVVREDGEYFVGKFHISAPAVAAEKSPAGRVVSLETLASPSARRTSRRVGRRGHHAAAVAPADDDRFAFQTRIERFLHRGVERVHVDVEDTRPLLFVFRDRVGFSDR